MMIIGPEVCPAIVNIRVLVEHAADLAKDFLEMTVVDAEDQGTKDPLAPLLPAPMSTNAPGDLSPITRRKSQWIRSFMNKSTGAISS